MFAPDRHHFRRPFIIVIAVVVLVGCGTGAAFALSSRSAPSAGAIDPALTSQLSIFSHPRTSNDSLPASFGSVLTGAYAAEQPNLAKSREVTADDGQTSYLVPAQDGLCVINSNESFCAPLTKLPGAAVVDLCSPTLPTGRLELEWLLPDGATNVALGMSNGTTTPYPSGYNVYITQLTLNSQTPVPSMIEWNSLGSQHHALKTPIPAGAQDAACQHPPNFGMESSTKPSGGYVPDEAWSVTSKRPMPIAASR
ncbi:MAG: hypothetical protein ACRET5_12550 [Steroidobacteraceae bacterium]